MSSSDGAAAAKGSLFTPELLSDPHTGYAALRDQGPVLRTTTPDGAPVWLVTRYDDVRAALADPRLSLSKTVASASGEHGASMPAELDAHLLNLDPPDHTRLRRLVTGVFTARRVEALRPLVAARTAALLDAVREPEVDLIGALAYPLAMNVICDVLGVGAADRRDFRAWTDTLRSPAPDAALASRQALGRMHDFLRGLVAAKRSSPGEDLLSGLVTAREQDDRLTEPELVALSFLLLFAGYDNAAHLIGNTLLALLTHPRVLGEVRSGVLPVDRVLEETLRWQPPSMLASRRFARRDMEIAGVPIAAGDRVWLSLVSANRDQTRFPEADSFRPNQPAAHLGFGHGLHYCLGAALARLEAETAITAVLQRSPRIALAVPLDQLEWAASFRSRGLTRLPVTWR